MKYHIFVEDHDKLLYSKSQKKQKYIEEQNKIEQRQKCCQNCLKKICGFLLLSLTNCCENLCNSFSQCLQNCLKTCCDSFLLCIQSIVNSLTTCCENLCNSFSQCLQNCLKKICDSFLLCIQCIVNSLTTCCENLCLSFDQCLHKVCHCFGEFRDGLSKLGKEKNGRLKVFLVILVILLQLISIISFSLRVRFLVVDDFEKDLYFDIMGGGLYMGFLVSVILDPFIIIIIFLFCCFINQEYTIIVTFGPSFVVTKFILVFGAVGANRGEGYEYDRWGRRIDPSETLTKILKLRESSMYDSLQSYLILDSVISSLFVFIWSLVAVIYVH